MNADYKMLDVCFDYELEENRLSVNRKEIVWLSTSEIICFSLLVELCYVNDWNWEDKRMRYKLKDFNGMFDWNYWMTFMHVLLAKLRRLLFTFSLNVNAICKLLKKCFIKECFFKWNVTFGLTLFIVRLQCYW